MHRRLLLAFGAAALITAGSIPATVMAAGPTRIGRQVDISKIDKSFKPLLADSKRVVNVVLQLAGTPATGIGVSNTQQRVRAAGLATAQAAVSKDVAKAGATVTGHYRYAYNGLRVRTTLGHLPDLAGIRGVVAIRPLHVYKQENVAGVPAIGAPTAWGTPGVTGAGMKIAVIDTGIDYTHATFGGDGTPEAYTGNDRTAIELGTFPTAKVVDGWDFAGDDYDADGDFGSVNPAPDPDPLDCGGHGSHVSATAAGQGVMADHSTFTGPYNSATIGNGSGFIVGPGVAPEATLVALKVFGCEGSTDLVTDALEWVAQYNAFNSDPIDVVNMSLGAPFGTGTDPDAVATNNLVAAGVVVVASAGNESAVPYITGSPAAATRAISVAALDLLPTHPMASIDLLPGVPAINMNNHTGLPLTGNLHVLTGDAVLGCLPTDFDGATAGTIVVVKRGVCAFVDKGANAAAAGAIGIIVINRDDTPAGELPPYIGYNPESFDIPMIGIAKGAAFTEGAAATISAAAAVANPTYRQVADFSSSGPRFGDSVLKPDLGAPGVTIQSALVGSGWNATTYSGTSMAAPMTTGAVALVLQAHPSWTPLKVKAALANTADGAVVGYTPLRAGAGKIRVDRAVRANVLATTSDGTASLSFGYLQAAGGLSASKRITITNEGSSAAVYRLASSLTTVTLKPTSVTVPAHKSVSVVATAKISAATLAASCSADQYAVKACTGLYNRTGVITATPRSAKAGQYALRVPFLVVPRSVSSLTATRSSRWTTSAGRTSGRLVLTNTGNHSATASIFALGVTDAQGDGFHGTDIRAAGVQKLDALTLAFGVNMFDKFSSFAPHQVDISVDVDADRVADYHVLSYDNGLITAGAYDGVVLSLVTDASYGLLTGYLADAPLNGSTVVLPAGIADLGLAPGTSSFSYRVAAFDGATGWVDYTGWSQAFDAVAPRISTGPVLTAGNPRVIARKSAISVGAAFYRASNPRGWMVVTMDDRNGAAQADIVGLP